MKRHATLRSWAPRALVWTHVPGVGNVSTRGVGVGPLVFHTQDFVAGLPLWGPPWVLYAVGDALGPHHALPGLGVPRPLSAAPLRGQLCQGAVVGAVLVQLPRGHESGLGLLRAGAAIREVSGEQKANAPR